MDLVWSDFVKWWELFHFFVFQILWCLYMIIHVCSSSRRKIKGNEYKLRTIRTLSCPVSCIFMNKPKQKYNQATNKTGKDKIKWIALIQPGFNHVNLKLESKFWWIWMDSYSRNGNVKAFKLHEGFKLMFARRHSEPIRHWIRERDPITKRLRKFI